MAINLSQFDRGVFLVNLLGIIYDDKTGRVLIGKRENDPFIKELVWCFPGGRPTYDKSLEASLRHEIKIKTGLDVKVGSLVFARLFDVPKEFMLIYYFCTVIGGSEKAGEKLTELKWVKPSEIKNYFTTSIDQKVIDFLNNL